MNPLYNLGISLYSLAVRLVSGRNPKARKMLSGQAETIGRLKASPATATPQADGQGPVWIHVASLGEFEQGRPLIERLRAEQPDRRIVLSFFSPSGYEVRKDYPLVDCVVYMPFDKPARVREFLDTLRPSMAIFIKYEFWGNYLHELRRRDIPVYLVSAIFRPSQSFFQWWGGLFRDMLGCYTHLYVQDDNSRRLLATIGVTNVTVTGDTRLDRVHDIMSKSEPIPALEQWKARDDSPVLIAGSSWPADEDIYMPWLSAHPEVRSIVAPHEFDDTRIDALIARLGPGAMTLSDLEAAYGRDGAVPDGVRHIVVDCFGRLATIYRYGTIAHVGGAFGTGLHNINEAAVWGLPVTFGPNHHKFKEATDLMECHGAFEINDYSQFDSIVTNLLTKPAALAEAGEAARRYIGRNRGATRRVFDDIFEARRRDMRR